MWHENNGPNIRVRHLIKIGVKYNIVENDCGIATKDNLNIEGHSRWFQIIISEVSKNQVHWTQRVQQAVLRDVQSHYTHHVVRKYSIVNRIVAVSIQYGRIQP